MVRHFSLDKTTTIVKGKLVNMGMNPVVSITYGDTVCRGLVHFDERLIKEWIDEEGIDASKITFRLKMTNCFSVDSLPYDKTIISAPGAASERASSFNLDFFKLSKNFDAGRGYEYDSDFAINNKKSYSQTGANWEFAKSGERWNKLGAKDVDAEIIDTKSFDFGLENINLDITDYVLDVLSGTPNYGIGIKMSDEIEELVLDKQQYVGFFGLHTNTFFHPYVEAVYDDVIRDDRECFYDGQENRLYLYTFSDGERIKLDEIPTCTIDGISYNVTCAGKGVYYATVDTLFDVGNDMPVMYDEWSNLYYNGVELDDVCLEFVVLPKNNVATIGNVSSFKDMTVPSIYGIDDSEELHLGETREVTVDFRKKYTTDKKELSHTSDYRLYVKDGRREFDVISYTPIERGFLNNFFVIHTDDLIPGKYYIDIRTKQGRDMRHYKDVLHFIVKDDLTERYY